MTDTTPLASSHSRGESSGPPLLEVTDLKKHFQVQSKGLFGGQEKWLHAVDGVHFELHKGEALGLVGESGCGKSTAARTIVGLYPATSGSVRFDGRELTTLSPSQWRPMRRRIQMIFQDPYASLDPRQTVASILGEPLKIHGIGRPARRKIHAMALLEAVGLNPRHIHRYPHEFSGGQRQRIGIARALALEPELIVCDEPVSALDVSIQAQVLNLLGELKERFGLSYLFIAHDLAVVRHLCTRIAVMYLGRIVEIADRDELFANPTHPYTRALLSAIPEPDPERERTRQRIVLQGDVPSPIDPPSGCPFHPRCPKYAATPDARCTSLIPPLEPASPGSRHEFACHLERGPA
ncbi:MAG: ATP-binding cassette domain-containing protein [Planctomycetes bacterium]|nr:ATP-binding cassette domain-containing protein [Planctomycetota bacterium]MCB9910593.1 ATP-binding cassette domain-containing protein [Planctomycetota bacterium]HPF14516.1 ATP-binding cassette domain-containing protein [Planctomycetota bacterium]